MSAEAVRAASTGRPPPWRDVRVLRIAFQVLFLLAVAALGAYLWGNFTTNMRRQGIGTSFAYVDRPAGFAILNSSFRATQRIRDAIAVGVRNTMAVAFVGILLATALGILIGISRLSQNWLVRKAAAVYVETLRNIPVLVVIIFVHFAVVLKLPRIQQATTWGDVLVISNSGVAIPGGTDQGNLPGFLLAVAGAFVAVFLVVRWRRRRFDATGRPSRGFRWGLGTFVTIVAGAFFALGRPIGVSRPAVEGFGIQGGLLLSPEYTSLLVALVIYTASHIAEIVRGSILAVSTGQSEAARALGLNELQRLRFVVIPQAFRIMLPPLGNQSLNLTKNSSLAVAIGYPELTKVTDLIIGNGNPAPQSIAVLMLIYLMISLGISLIVNLINRRLQYTTR